MIRQVKARWEKDALELANLIERYGGEVVTLTPSGHYNGVGNWTADASLAVWYRVKTPEVAYTVEEEIARCLRDVEAKRQR